MGKCASKPSFCKITCHNVFASSGTPNVEVPNHCKNEVDSTPYLPKYFLEDTLKVMKIQIQSEKRVHDDSPSSYPVLGRTRGTALILNNCEPESKIGSEVDVKNITQLLKAIRMKVKIKNNLKTHEIHKSVQAFAKGCKASEMDLCVLVIIGNVRCTPDRNKLAEIGGTDNKFIPTFEIIEQFSDEKCPQFKGKPKFFLFHGHYYHVSNVEMDFSTKLSLKDMFVANTVLTGNLQKQKLSSYYIQALCHVFMDNVYEKDLESMIQKVEQIVYNHDRSTQHTHYDNLYFKKCYLYAT